MNQAKIMTSHYKMPDYQLEPPPDTNYCLECDAPCGHHIYCVECTKMLKAEHKAELKQAGEE